MTDVIFQLARTFRTVTLLFHITRFFNICCIGEVCSNQRLFTVGQVRVKECAFLTSCVNVTSAETEMKLVSFLTLGRNGFALSIFGSNFEILQAQRWFLDVNGREDLRRLWANKAEPTLNGFQRLLSNGDVRPLLEISKNKSK